MRYIEFVLLLSLFFLVGCVATKEMISDYDRCMANAVCASEVQKIRESSYTGTQVAVDRITLPSVSEAVAVIVSSGLAFGIGVLKGRKLKR